MDETLTRLSVASERLAALRDQISDEMQRRDLLVADAIESGHTVRTVSRAAAVDPARVCRIVGAVLADRQTADPLSAIPRQRSA